MKPKLKFIIFFHNGLSYKKLVHGTVANPGLEVKSCRNAVLLNPTNNSTTMLRYIKTTTTTVIPTTATSLSSFMSFIYYIVCSCILFIFGVWLLIGLL
jgi:hypothetical protein